jgi:hypothetical protein
MPTRNEINDFSLMIDNLAEDLICTRMDAIIHHCEKTGMELEVASTLISAALKAKIREEAEELNLLRSTSKLPL